MGVCALRALGAGVGCSAVRVGALPALGGSDVRRARLRSILRLVRLNADGLGALLCRVCLSPV